MARTKKPRGRFVTTVHGRGAAPLDAMLDLTERASKAAPLEEVLASLTEQIASLLSVDVCSIYLRDAAGEGDELVLRATHGFPPDVVGTVRMRVGEGLTGFAVECLRPVSVAEATVDERNKAFEALDEGRFPALCALPLIDGGRAIGALVVQRRVAKAFSPREVVLVAAMAPAVLLGVERARARQRALAEDSAPRPRSERRPVEITLRGEAASAGRGLGVLSVRQSRIVAPDGRGQDPRAERARLAKVLEEAAIEAASLGAWAEVQLASRPPSKLRDEARACLGAVRYLLDDGRILELALDHVAGGATATAAVEKMVREYVRLSGTSADETLQLRAHEMEGLAGRILARLAEGGGAADEPLSGKVWVAGRLTVLEAVELCRVRAVGALLAAPASASPGLPVARALELPVVSDVKALFRWATDGDRALVDGDAGVALLNPSRSAVALHRRDRRT